MKTIIISLGGSLIVPKKVDRVFLQKFKKLILEYVKKGNQAVIICGGGATARKFQMEAKKKNPKVSDEKLDWLGIDATKINAKIVSNIFRTACEKKLLGDPNKKIRTQKKVILGHGFKPGWTTDKDAVMAANTYGADTVVNLSDIAYLYNKDPRKYKTAKKIMSCTWDRFLKIVGGKHSPGANYPFGPEAAKLAKKSGVTVVVMKGSDLMNFKKFLEGKKFKGTIIGRF